MRACIQETGHACPLWRTVLGGTAGAVVALAGVEANYTITLTWKREEKREEKSPRRRRTGHRPSARTL